MKHLRLPDVRISMGRNYRPALNVIDYISTRRGDPERGPMIRLRTSEARIRLIENGELVWVIGPRRQDLAVLIVDDTVPEASAVLRDIAGVSISEAITVVKPDLDTPNDRQVG